ncbi:MAG: hypothetical protein EZS28_038860 [Streblomastix strix]|uniref:Uncharacterized protein n=1 Tax=Streblomastix strix TaxID=222440 RepID=A0A5J4U608_9EUKA|nr:MAG: hypothetical protein EZS28_038860 [Streblomastix strix]
MYDYFASPDPMFNDIQSSGLFDKIEQMIKDKIEVEKEQKKYSNEAEYEKDPNSEEDWETRIADQIMKIVKERICPLIHLNCPPQINCQQCINIPHSPALQELKSAIFQNLFNVSKNNQQFIDILVNDHNIIPHLTHPLIQFASESQLKKKTNSQVQHDQQQTESSSSISLITSSINLLDDLINNNKCKVVINTPNVLRSLCTLSGYKINIHFSQENDQQTFAVRHSSRGCLWQIQFWGDASVQTELVNARYVRVLVIAISTASGSGEEQDDEINGRLLRISKFLRHLHQGDYSFPPQPLLVRRSVEQIEEEGGNEEIDSQLIKKKSNYNIKTIRNEAKGRILNYFIEQGNTRPDWYNL